MPFYTFVWDDENEAHLAEHDVSTDEFAEVVCDPDFVVPRSQTRRYGMTGAMRIYPWAVSTCLILICSVADARAAAIDSSVRALAWRLCSLTPCPNSRSAISGKWSGWCDRLSAWVPDSSCSTKAH